MRTRVAVLGTAANGGSKYQERRSDETTPHQNIWGRYMKNHVLAAALWSVSLVGILSCAVVCPVYSQGVREIGSTSRVSSDSTVVQAANAEVQLPIHITEPGNYRLNTNLVGITPNAVILIESSDVTLDLNGFSISGGGPGILATGSNVAIVNGSIHPGDGGAISFSGSNCRVEGLRIYGGRDGISLGSSPNCIVKNNTVEAAHTGILCSGCVVSGNTVTTFSDDAIGAVNSSLVVGNTATGYVALHADDTTGYAQNVLHGYHADVSGGVQIGDNLCVTSKICLP